MRTMPFGKHRGAYLSDIPTDYLCWLSGLADLSYDLRTAVRRELACRGIRPRAAYRARYTPSPPPSPLERLAAVMQAWYRQLVWKWHPDRGGSNDAMAAINDAFDLLKQYLNDAEFSCDD